MYIYIYVCINLINVVIVDGSIFFRVIFVLFNYLLTLNTYAVLSI